MAASGPHEPPRLDLDRTAEELRLHARARSRGARGLPPADAADLDEVEREIVERIRGRALRRVADDASRLEALDREIQSTDVPQRVRALRHVPTAFRRRLRELTNRTSLGLARAEEEYALARSGYEAFRALHRIEREPRYPASKLAPAALLMALGVAKAGFAASLPALGGHPELAFVAVLVAFIDVLIAFSLGRVAPWVAAPQRSQRLAGWGAVAGFLAWAGAVNALAGSAGTIALGWLLSLGALAVGAGSDDRTPGYGRLHRRLLRAHDQRDYWRSAALDGAATLHERQQLCIDQAERTALRERDALARAVEAKARLLAGTLESSQHLENVGNALLRLYRDANGDARTTPPPPHFDAGWRLALETPGTGSLGFDRSRVRDAEEAARHVAALADEARRAVRADYDAFVRGCRAD
ncbi:MAG: hypothetical protein ACQGVC_14910 [Myxococcota bacterium]